MPLDRAQALRRLGEERFDVVVVGGGITGAGVALDAASRGLSTALVERQDLASGTSSKSSKLVHGGLRYLQQREFRLVYEALAERQRLRHTAPHLVELLPFLIPVLGKGGAVHPKLVRALDWALWLYDLTGGARIGKLHERISGDEALARMPTLRRDRVLSGFIYYDARTDDARLTLAVAQTAAQLGAAVATWCPVTGFLDEGGEQVGGVRVAPPDGPPVDVRADVVINATGVWADEVSSLVDGAAVDGLRPAKGVHITVPWDKVRNEIAVVVPVPKDRRSVFVVPLGDRTYIGTTDTDYDGPLDDPHCTSDDVDYLLGAINASISTPLTRADVLATWAGLRPLVRAAPNERTADLSRRHRVQTSSRGVITVTGGKLTTYRRMAADAVDTAAERLGSRRRSRTAKLALVGAEGFTALLEPGAADRLGVTPELLHHLAHRYGGEARTVTAMIAAEPDLGLPLVEGLPYVRAEAVYAARYEMACTLDDILSRRIPARWLAADASVAAAAVTAELVASDLGWDGAEVERQVTTYSRSVAADRQAADLPALAPSP